MTSTLSDKKATTTKRKRLEQLEIIIKDSYKRQGEALKEIRDTRLYLLDYDSFDAYCKDVWLHNRAWADRLIAATKVAGNIKQIDPIGSILKNESQARALKKLTPEAQKAILVEVAENSSNVTARELQKAADKYKKMSTSGTQSEEVKIQKKGDLPSGRELTTGESWENIREVLMKTLIFFPEEANNYLFRSCWKKAFGWR